MRIWQNRFFLGGTVLLIHSLPVLAWTTHTIFMCLIFPQAFNFWIYFRQHFPFLLEALQQCLRRIYRCSVWVGKICCSDEAWEPEDPVITIGFFFFTLHKSKKQITESIRVNLILNWWRVKITLQYQTEFQKPIFQRSISFSNESQTHKIGFLQHSSLRQLTIHARI